MRRQRLLTICRSIHIIICLFLIWSCPDSMHAQFHSILTRIPSESAGNEGIAVLIKIPLSERYIGEGSPIAVYLAGGFKSTGIGDTDAGLVHYGFIEIQFNFPGNDDTGELSGGEFDFRGPASLRATCDVIRFALGTLADQDGKSLSEIVAPINPLYSNVGLIGYSNGGNTNICVAGVHGEEIDQLAWILNWESPVGDGMPQAEAGAKSEGLLRPLNPEQNPAYNPDTGLWNLEKLSYHPNIQIPLLDNTDSSVTGGLYFDFDEDNEVDPGEDFIPYPLVFQTDSCRTAYYSERLRKKAENANLIPNPSPEHIPSFEETESFWYWRNGNYWIDSTIQKIPHLMFMICASDTDHV